MRNAMLNYSQYSWYRKTFVVPANDKNKKAYIYFDNTPLIFQATILPNSSSSLTIFLFFILSQV